MALMEAKSLAGTFAVTSIVFVGLLAISPIKDYLSEWRHYQSEYNQLIGELPVRVKPVAIGIKQVWLDELGIVDRCTSCHLGVADTRMADLPQPYRTHPTMYHEVNEFGCTPCHGGQGVATTVTESIGREEFWNKSMLPAEFMEAGCGSCHIDDVVTDAPILTAGRELLKQNNCSGCHNIPGIEKTFTPGLDGIGQKVSRRWLERWLRNPKDVLANSRMPVFSLDDDELRNLVDFMMTLKQFPGESKLEPLPDILADEDWDETVIALGSRRFREARCISCHQINERGGSLASDLGTVASKLSAKWLYNYIRNPHTLQPGVPMPRYGFSKGDAVAVTAYMLSEFIDWELEEPDEDMEYTPAPDFYRKGLKIFNDLNCSGCHSVGSVKEVSRNMGPDLAKIGQKPLVELEFGHADITKTRWSFLYHKVKDPTQFLENARMPSFAFSPEEVQTITTALLALLGDPLLETDRESDGERRFKLSPPGGPVGRIMQEFACLSCHTIGDDGFLLASDLSREGSRVTSPWLHNYFRVPYTIRPILTERMPNLFMDDHDIDRLSTYIEIVFIDDGLDDSAIPAGDPQRIALGKKLALEVYGCQSCHQVGGKGGYVGPPLEQTARRSRPGWVYSWIKDPQKYRPDTIDPNQNLTDSEARDIAAYIMSLGNEQP